MTLHFSAEAEEFRTEVRAWLTANLDDDLRAIGPEGAVAGGPEQVAALRRWQRRLADAGLAAIAWPREYGGRDAGPLEQVVLVEELDRAGAPGELNPIGMSNIAPAIMTFGTAEQRALHLPRMLRGDDVWCQGFSEPGAGSDLAALRTRAVREGDDYVVTGQKVWTTLAHVADYCELLVRTDPEAQRHRGISCLLVDMSLPGVEVRPLRTLTGDTEFNEIFFDEVRVPAGALLGGEGDGWRVAMTTLNNERAGVLKLYLASRRKVAQLVEGARSAGTTDQQQVRRRLAALQVEAELLRLLAEASVAAAVAGEAPGPEGSLAKLVWSELDGHIADTAAAALGPAANSGRWGSARLATRGLTLAGGTTQVNKNVVAQRVLGLPRG